MVVGVAAALAIASLGPLAQAGAGEAPAADPSSDSRDDAHTAPSPDDSPEIAAGGMKHPVEKEAARSGLRQIPLSISWDVNAAGIVLGLAEGQPTRAAWVNLIDGVVHTIHGPNPSAETTNPSGINDSGLVAAEYYDAGAATIPHAFTFQLGTGEMKMIHPLPGDDGVGVIELNNSGLMIGQSYRKVGVGGSSTQPVIHDARTGVTRDLAELVGGSDFLFANDISDTGWIVGLNNGDGFAYNMDTEQLVAIPPVSGDQSFDPLAVNNRGLVVGRTTRPPASGNGFSENRAAYFDLNTGTTRLLPGAEVPSTAFDVNDRGVIVGFYGNGAFAYHPVTGVVPVGPNFGFTDSIATSVNEFGVVLVSSSAPERGMWAYQFRLFTDIAGSPHVDNIERLAALDVTTGYPDGTYRPNVAVSRAHMAAFLKRAYDLPDAPEGPTFPDTAGTTHEAAIRDVVAAGISNGASDGNFHPNAAVTRGQMAAFIARAEQLEDGGSSQFCDTGDHTFEQQISAVAEAGIAAGGTDGCFRPNDPVTRAQMATFIVRAVG